MARRFLVGALLVAVIFGVFFLDWRVLNKPFASRTLLWLLTLGGLYEVITIGARRVECSPGLFFYGGVAVIAIVVPYVVAGAPVPFALIALAATVAGGIRLLGMAPLRSAAATFPEAVLLSGAILYTAGLMSFLDRILVHGSKGLKAAFAVVAISKTCDMCGYFVGTLVGRKRIVPSVSPKKTWEGTIAGVLGSTGVALLLWKELTVPPAFAAAMGVLLGLATFLGDLIESGLKRWAGVKDSASLLPEFGGFLDLLDGILVASPVAVICLLGT